MSKSILHIPTLLRIFYITFIIVYILFGAVLPIYYIKSSYTFGDTYIKFYSHLYYYASYFGWVALLALIYPFEFLIQSEKLRGRLPAFCFCLLILFASFIIYIDTMSENITPFELKADVLQQDSKLSEHFSKASPSNSERIYYQNETNRLIVLPENVSFERFLHYFSITVQVLSILFTAYIILAFLVMFTDRRILALDSYITSCIFLIFAASMLYIWLVMRFIFDSYKADYFASISGPLNTIVIAFVFVLFTALLVLLLRNLIDSQGLGNGISILAVFVTIALALVVNTYKIPLSEFLGKNAESSNYLTVWAGIFAWICVLFGCRYFLIAGEDEEK